jgi:hypothetical protein
VFVQDSWEVYKIKELAIPFYIGYNVTHFKSVPYDTLGNISLRHAGVRNVNRFGFLSPDKIRYASRSFGTCLLNLMMVHRGHRSGPVMRESSKRE